MNETLEILKTRRSIRAFNDKPVPMELIEQIVEAGTYAPSAKNGQRAKIIAITNKEVRDEIMKINAEIMGVKGMDPFYGAPVILMVIAEKSIKAFDYMDGSLVMGNLLNAAWALGVGSIWIHRADEELQTTYGQELLKKLGIEGEYVGIGHCALGYFDIENPEAKPRKKDYVYWVK